ncbi:TetR/AcrR family transcriptional regulator [Marivibrio halodurans]|uniref:TetR/AcrR family transcriptional regulator n=1 Tax=Marivibrio halodurans TaxID=2039722 RepID=A0A8J7V0Z9_9PROT|nr:TetR/AcrR family transcriptional regulator [Marivibrio halodurans]MBP5855810.1 TetR/AcrR family transcriptional regulator [Marivibrio halodurans]
MPPQDRATSKQAQILEGARGAFTTSGYEGTSVDEIAQRAGVSKATVYKHFADKKDVFLAFVRCECTRHAAQTFDTPPSEGDIRTILIGIANSYLHLILSNHAQAVFRIVVAESQRFPEIGRAFQEAGPETGRRRLERILAGGVARGELMIDDTDLAARQFLELCKADLFYERLYGGRTEPTATERDVHARKTVDMFLRAYGTPTPRA